jgi:hypothetical protein
VLARQCQRQTRPQSEVQRGCDSVPPNGQKAIQASTAPSDGDGAKFAQVGRPGLAGARLQHGQPAPEALGSNSRGASDDDGLHLLVDSTSIKMLGEGEWKTKKHRADYRRQWRKVHLGIDATTLEIRAIEVTDNAIGDAPMLPFLLDQIADDEIIASVSGDGGYDTKSCHEGIAQRGAQAIISTRRNAKPWKDRRLGGAARNAILKLRVGLAGRYGKSALATTDAASLKPKCVASSCSVNASWGATSTVRLQRYRYAQRS